MFGIFNRSAKTAPATQAPTPAVVQPVIVAPPAVQAPVVAPTPQPTKLERLHAQKRTHRDNEVANLALFNKGLAETEALKKEYQNKVNEERAEKAAILALAEEIRLALAVSEAAAAKAKAVMENLDNLTEVYAESLIEIEDKKETLLDNLLAEFGC